MPNERTNAEPKIYFLNERHQLTPAEKEGGRGPGKVVGVDWSTHGGSLKSEIANLRAARQRSGDPSSKMRAFVLAAPQDKLEKASNAQDAKEGKKEHEVSASGKEAQLIERLGFNLISVMSEGSAIVHATDEGLEQMMLSLGHLDSLGVNERSKWAHLKRFGEIPPEFKARLEWWDDAKFGKPLSVAIDLQPFLSRDEVDAVIKLIDGSLVIGEGLKKIGKEFNGRVWISASLLPDSILRLANEFQAIFAIHPPLGGIASAEGSHEMEALPNAGGSNSLARTLPCVAVFDTGIPTDHLHLSQSIRGTMVGRDAVAGVCSSHGSMVASRVVFGDVDCHNGSPSHELTPVCSVYDVRVGDIQFGNGPARIFPDAVEPAFEILNSTAPDVRVFNLSIDADADVDGLAGGYRDAWMRRIADLDNRIFSDDVLVVVSAGNSDEGVIPNPPYPRHYRDKQWRLRAWPRCFNALTCGGTATELSSDGVATESGAPSPFTRVGPGIAKSPKPDFSANAGNGRSDYRYQMGSGLGVWACNENGLWEDVSGTSFAAPLLARDAARTFALLQQRCEAGVRPFACLVKACLALHARRADISSQLKKLADATLGYGQVDFESIETQSPDRAVFLWQGIIANEDQKVIVELPVPGAWIRAAKTPILRLVASWDTPVNHAAEEVWACRKTAITLRPSDGKDALKGKNKRGRAQYTLLRRDYFLSGELSASDSCLLELSYSHPQMAPYPGSFIVNPQQRIGIAFELFDDDGENPVSPHSFVQSLPVAASLARLSVQVPASRNAISIKAF